MSQTHWDVASNLSLEKKVNETKTIGLRVWLGIGRLQGVGLSPTASEVNQ